MVGFNKFAKTFKYKIKRGIVVDLFGKFIKNGNNDKKNNNKNKNQTLNEQQTNKKQIAKNKLNKIKQQDNDNKKQKN